MKPSHSQAFYHLCFHAFDSALSVDPVRAASSELEISLPRYPSRVVRKICADATALFASEPILLRISSPLIVVGDLHGHFLDLVRIFKHCGLPPQTRYLFLGDVIDRGSFSLETLLMVYLLKLSYPQDFFLIRGNHEFRASTGGHEFERELSYLGDGASVYEHFLDSFGEIPIAAIVDGQTLCVHGGVGPTLVSPSQITALSRPIDDLSSDIVKGLLWSDPSESVEEFEPSPRGIGSQFGQAALFRFLRAAGLFKLVRGHEFVAEGVASHFDGRLTTVFSASNYCGTRRNAGAVLGIRGGVYEALVFAPLEWLPREQARFVDIPDDRGRLANGQKFHGAASPFKEKKRCTSESPLPRPERPFDFPRWKAYRRLS
jgi:protein phosphatase